MKIIFSDSLTKVKSISNALKGGIACVILSPLRDLSRADALFKSSANFNFFDKEELIKKYKDHFKSEYIEFIARLNCKQRQFDWNALNFSSKSRLSFDFYYRLFDAWIINHLLNSVKTDNIVIISDDRLLMEQIRYLAQKNGCIFIKKISCSGKEYLLRFLHFSPVFLIVAFMRAFIHLMLSRFFLFPRPLRDKDYYVIKTMLSANSFGRDGNFKDVYFCKLVDYLRKKNVDFLVNANVFSPYCRNLLRILRCRKRVKIFTREAYLPFLGIIKCLIFSLWRYWKVFGISKAELDGLDVVLLVKGQIRRECAGKDYFLNLLEYYSIMSFKRNINFRKIIYPFEHKSWESMLILGLDGGRERLDIIGYQHTSIAPKHTNFLLGRNEARYIPLPDRVICMGAITKNIMKDYGNFPETMLQVGAALRQDFSALNGLSHKGRKIRNILVALTTDTNEYARIIDFLKTSFSNEHPYAIRVRPHPLMYIERKIKLSSSLVPNFQIDSEESLACSLSWADIVFYSSSTVSIEALWRGIPVVYIDFGEALCPDPLFELNDFKWQVSKPDEVADTLNRIKQMPEDRFNTAKDKARGYACEYIYPSTWDRLAVFTQ